MNHRITVLVIAILCGTALAAALAVASWWQTLALARSLEDSLQSSQLQILHHDFQSNVAGIRAEQFQLQSEAAQIRAQRIALSIPISALWTRAAHSLKCNFESAELSFDLQKMDQLPTIRWPSLAFKRGLLTIKKDSESIAKFDFHDLNISEKGKQIRYFGRGKLKILAPFAEQLGLAQPGTPSSVIDVELTGELDRETRTHHLNLTANDQPQLNFSGPELSLLAREADLSGPISGERLQMLFSHAALSWTNHLELESETMRATQQANAWQFSAQKGDLKLAFEALPDMLERVQTSDTQLDATALSLHWLKAPEWASWLQKADKNQLIASDLALHFQSNQLEMQGIFHQGKVRFSGQFDAQSLVSGDVHLTELHGPEMLLNGHWMVKRAENTAYALQGEGQIDWNNGPKTIVKSSMILSGYLKKLQLLANLSVNGTPGEWNVDLNKDAPRIELRFEEISCQNALAFLPRNLLAFYDPSELDSPLRPRFLWQKGELRVHPNANLPAIEQFQMPCLAQPLNHQTSSQEFTKNPYAMGLPWRILTDRGPVYVLGLPRKGDGQLPLESEIIIYIHGYWENVDKVWNDHHLAQQFRNSGRQALFIVPEAPLENADSVHWPSYRELLQAIQNTGLKVPKGPVTAIGHSGAYRTLAPWATDERLAQLILIDGFYGYEDAFFQYLQQKRGQLILVGAQTDTRGLKFAHKFQNTRYYQELPEAFSDQDRQSPFIYISSQRGHWDLITKGDVIPQILKQLPISKRR